jgi:phosphatidylserine/phosphatidylglycerophosphate/cardiolipin synthase-like enzyme
MKKHFLVVLIMLSAFSLLVCARSEYLFSPKGNVTQRVIEEITKAQNSIVAAVYMITSQKITDALAAASARGVEVRVVTDSGSVQSPYGRIYHLLQAGVNVRVYCPSEGNRKFPPLMHTKYAVIDRTVSIEGSFNWTQSAEHSNEEHLRITNNSGQRDALLKHFESLFNERATTAFYCNQAQIAAWNKKQVQKKVQN